MRPTLLVPRRTSGGCIAAAAMIGVALGVCDTFLQFDGAEFLVLSLAALVLPGFILGSILALRCRNPLVAVVAGSAMFAAMSISEMTARWTRLDSGWQSFLTVRELAWTFGVIALEAAFASLLSLAGFGLVRLIVQVKDGDGSECWRCLYKHDNPSATVCPECGRALDGSQCRLRFLHRTFDWLHQRRAWWNVIAAIVLLIVAGAFVKLNRRSSREADQFIARFEPLGKVQPGFVYTDPMAKPTASLGAIIDTGKNGLVVWVAYLPKDVPGLPSMQLQLHKRLGGALMGESFQMSSPRVLCNIDRDGAEWILANRLPQELIDAMVAGASPSPIPASGPDVLIEPRQFLPSEAWKSPH